MDTQIIKQYWESRSEREQILLLVGGIVLFICLIYFLIYSPIENAVSEDTAAFKDKYDTLMFMKKTQKLTPPTQKATKINTSELLTVISNQLKAEPSLSAFPAELNQTSSGDIQLSFKSVPFNLIMTWLQELSTKYDITIKQLSIHKTNIDGVVGWTLVLG